MWLPAAEVIEAVVICLVAATTILMLVIQQIQVRRHERLRGELATILISLGDNIADINARLAAAGYPSRLVAPPPPLIPAR